MRRPAFRVWPSLIICACSCAPCPDLSLCVPLVLISREFICEMSLVDRIGQEKSHACLSRYQVSLKKGFEGALIMFSHLSRWPQQPSLWCKTNNLMNCWLGVCVISINVQLSSLHFIPNSHVVTCFQGKLCTTIFSVGKWRWKIGFGAYFHTVVV